MSSSSNNKTNNVGEEKSYSGSVNSQTSSLGKRNSNLDAYFNNSPSFNNKSRSPPRSPRHLSPSSPSYSSLKKNSKIMDYLKNEKMKAASSSSSSNHSSLSKSKSSITITDRENETDVLDDPLNQTDEISGSEIETETEDTESEVSIPTTKGKSESIRFDDSSKRISIKNHHHHHHHHHEGYMSLPVANNDLSRSVKNYSTSIDDWALSYKKAVNTKMEAMTMTYSELPPSLKAYRKKIKNRKKHPELYAEEEGVPLDYQYESIMNYDIDETTTMDGKLDGHGLESNSTEIIQVSEDESENVPLIPKPEDL